MDFFIFDINRHKHMILSFLESASLSHNEEIKLKKWFLWKFNEYPHTPVILSCAAENNEIIACVAFAKQNFLSQNVTVPGAISFETFVHPDYQRRGLFSKLLKKAEAECKKQGILVLLNFPNSNSLPGFMKSGWMKSKKAKYYIKPSSSFLSIRKMKDLREPFIPLKMDTLTLTEKIDFKQNLSNFIEQELNEDYIKWRFLTFKSNYGFLNSENGQVIFRVGYRGSVKEIQVLAFSFSVLNKNVVTEIRIKLKNLVGYDVLSFLITENHPIKNILRRNLFLSMPNGTNICVKSLNEEFNISKFTSDLILTGSIYHTY